MGRNLGKSGGGGKVCVTGWRNTCVMGGKGLILLGDAGGGKGLLRGWDGEVGSVEEVFAPNPRCWNEVNFSILVTKLVT